MSPHPGESSTLIRDHDSIWAEMMISSEGPEAGFSLDVQIFEDSLLDGLSDYFQEQRPKIG